MVTPAYPPAVGGIEAHVASLTEALSKLGVEVQVITQASGPLRRNPALVEFRRLPMTGVYQFAPGLLPWTRRHRRDFDLFHLHGYHAAPAGLVAPLVGGTPIVLTPHYHGAGHTRLARGMHRLYGAVNRNLIRRARAVICVSSAEADLLEDRYPWVRPKVEVIPNAVGSEGLLSAAAFETDNPVVLTAGRLVGYKNTRLVAEAVAALRSPVSLVVAGDGPERADLDDLARRHPAIELTGWLPRPELDRWFRTASIFVTLSEHEAFGMSLLEALTAGSWAIASDIPAHREVAALCGAEDRVTWLRLPCTAEQVGRALEDRLASGGRPPPLPRIWDWGEAARRTAALYHRLVTSPEVARPAGGVRGRRRVP